MKHWASIMCTTSDSYAIKGHNGNARWHDQYKLLYVFDRMNRVPLFFRVLSGNLMDKSAFIETLR